MTWGGGVGRCPIGWQMEAKSLLVVFTMPLPLRSSVASPGATVPVWDKGLACTPHMSPLHVGQGDGEVQPPWGPVWLPS